MRSIGDTVYWVEAYTNYGKSIPCPMCFGKRFVAIILGDGSKTDIECGMCSHGLDRATGQAKTWEPTALIHSGTISGISTKDGTKYEIGYSSVKDYECFASEAEADTVRDAKLKEMQERAAVYYKDNFINCKKKQIWSAGYHRSCIKSAEQTLQWHKMRLNMIEEAK